MTHPFIILAAVATAAVHHVSGAGGWARSEGVLKPNVCVISSATAELCAGSCGMADQYRHDA